jgi:hypothetical protein
MADLDTPIAALAERIREHSETIQTEEAVKTSVVLPFLRALGYDVFNPAEVVPEFTADTYGRRGEKVDYAIQRDGEIKLLVECKGLSTQLSDKHLGQLFRYFSVTKTRFALLTNGREYRFFSDLEAPNKMDQKPFFVFDILDYSSSALAELAKFSKQDFDVESILADAERLKYISAVKRLLASWMDAPPDGLVRLIASEVHDGRASSSVREMLSGVIQSAFREILRDRMRTRLSPVLEDHEPVDEGEALNEYDARKDEIETTQEEIEGFLMIKAMLRGEVEVGRIAMRDAKSYCAVLLDDNNRKPLARLHFNRKQKYIGLFDTDKEDRVAISSLDDMLDMAERVVATAKKYEQS